MIEYYNRHNRLASACPLSNLSPIFGPSIKRKIERREAVTQQREERVISSCLALETRIYQQNFAMLYCVQIKLSFIQTTTLIAEGITTNKASLRRFSSHRQDSSNNLCQRRAISPVSLEIEPVVQLERQELKLDFTAKWSTMKKLRWKLSRNRWFPRQITIHYQGLRNRKCNCLTKHVKLNLLIMCISISHIQECCE